MSAAVSKVAATRGTPLPGKRGHPVVNVSTSTISHTAQSRDFPFQRLKHFAWAVRFTSAGREQQCDRASLPTQVSRQRPPKPLLAGSPSAPLGSAPTPDCAVSDRAALVSPAKQVVSGSWRPACTTAPGRTKLRSHPASHGRGCLPTKRRRPTAMELRCVATNPGVRSAARAREAHSLSGK